jgi:hypothetical protein
MRTSRRPFLFGGAALLVSAPRSALAAGELEVSARLDPPRAAVIDIVVLTVEVVSRGGGGRLPQVRLPAELAAACEIAEAGTRSSFRSSFVNGRVSQESVSVTTWHLTPLRVGKLRFTVTAHDETGATARSAELELDIVGAAAAAAEPAESGPVPTRADAEVIMWATVDTAEAWVGQPVLYRLEVWERTRFTNIQIRTLPTFQDFWTEEVPEASQRMELVEGIPYRVHPGLARVLVPQRAGTLVVGPAEAVAGLRKRIASRAVEVRVKPLPAAGQPQGFAANNVGRFELEMAVDRPKVRQGEPFTLTWTVRGEGNLRFVDTGPPPHVEGARTYEPKVETVVEVTADSEGGMRPKGRRTYEMLVIPERSGRITIPEHKLAYFDPWKARYDVATAPEVHVDVTAEGAGGTVTEPPVGAAPVAGSEGDGTLIPPPPASVLARVTPREPSLPAGRWLAGMLAVPAIAGFAVAAAWLRERLAGDEHSRGIASRRQRRRELLARARASVATGSGFYVDLAALLQELALEHAGPGGVGLARPALLRVLRSSGIAPEHLAELEALLDACDAARFGASDVRPEERERLLHRTAALVHAFGPPRREGA